MAALVASVSAGVASVFGGEVIAVKYFYSDRKGYEAKDEAGEYGNPAGYYPNWNSIPNGLISNTKFNVADFKPNELSKSGKECKYFSKSDNVTTYFEFNEFNYMLNSTIYKTDIYKCWIYSCNIKVAFPINPFKSDIFKNNDMLYQLTGLTTIFESRDTLYERSIDFLDKIYFWCQPVFVNIVGIAKAYNHTDGKFIYQGRTVNTSMPLVFSNNVVGLIGFKADYYLPDNSKPIISSYLFSYTD